MCEETKTVNRSAKIHLELGSHLFNANRGFPMAPIHVTLGRIRLNDSPSGVLQVRCPQCHEGLAMHQPDDQLPDRLLGICLECRAWFLIESDAKFMVRLPDRDTLRDA